MTNQQAAVQEPYERRALLLHLGDVLETVFCLSQCADDYPSIGEALRGNDALAGFTLLTHIDEKMPPRDFIRLATGAFFVWPKSLLDETLNRPLLASTVQHDLFNGNARGWDAYVAERRRDVPWFGEDLSAETRDPTPVHTTEEATAQPEAGKASRYASWPWPDHTGDA